MNKRLYFGLGLSIFFIIAAVIIVSLNKEEDPYQFQPTTSEFKENLAFYPDEAKQVYPEPKNQYHKHAALRIIYNNQDYKPDPNIGYTKEILAIHTHDNSGVIHLHQDKNKGNFKFSDIMNAYGKTYNVNQFGDLKLDNNLQAQIYLNNKKIAFGNDFEVDEKDDIIVEFSSLPYNLSSSNKNPAFDFEHAPVRAL